MSSTTTALTDPVHRTPPLALRLGRLTKTFQGQPALVNVELEIRQGEVHCLLGQNGSGKSTLIKILAGYHSPDWPADGEIFGDPITVGSGSDAHARGVRFIHQDLGLIDSLTVADNLALGQRHHARTWLSAAREEAHAEQVFRSYGVDIDGGALVASLGPAQRAMTAIVRALHHGPSDGGILVLDEPTAALAESDKLLLFELLRKARDAGSTVVYVTHRLQEVFDLADRVSVLRSGRMVATRNVEDLDHDSLIALILGRALESVYPVHEQPAVSTEDALCFEDVSGGDLRSLSLTVARGEIVGVVGLSGSGTEDLPHLLFGSRPREGGRIFIGGEEAAVLSPLAAIRAGIAYSPGDRAGLGSIADWPVRENLTLPRLTALGPLRWLSRRTESREAHEYVTRFGVEPNRTESRFGSLSGGNQQKVLIAKWIRTDADIFVLEEPTAGVDVGARRGIYDAIGEVASQGAGVLMVTSDFEEAVAVCDRVAVLKSGELGAMLSKEELSVDRLLEEALRDPNAKERADA